MDWIEAAIIDLIKSRNVDMVDIIGHFNVDPDDIFDIVAKLVKEKSIEKITSGLNTRYVITK